VYILQVGWEGRITNPKLGRGLSKSAKLSSFRRCQRGICQRKKTFRVWGHE
jgi:hypothetical protein